MDIASWDTKKLKEFAIMDKWGSLFYIVIMALFLLVATLGMGFETRLDFMVFEGIIMIPQICIWFFLKRFHRKLYICRLEAHKKIVTANVEE